MQKKIQQLLAMAVTAKDKAYAPYSKYHVGAAICAKSGKIYTSCNVENISFPCGTCAEAGAIAAMVAGGDNDIDAILIVADGAELVYPCGACLQRIAEFATPQTIVYLATETEVCKTYQLKELLPYNFVAKELKDD